MAPSDVGEAPLKGTCPTVLWGFQKESRTFPTGYRSRVDFFGVPELVLWKLQFVNPKFHKSSSGSRWPKYISNSLTTRSKK